MQKSAPSFGRIAAMVVFALSCFALVLFLWLAFGGPVPLQPKGYRVTASFAQASQLATEADVRISGVPVGKVKAIEPDTETGRSIVTLELDAKYAPLPSDARALLRQKTLLGETYVELTPGTAQAQPLPEGGRLADGQIGTTVQLDEILRTFDPPTRAAFRVWMQTQAEAITGHGRDLNNALGNLGPFAEDAAVLVDILNRQQPAVQRLIANTGVVFEALTERGDQLRDLIENSNRVFATTAERDEELRQAFVALPTFERESRLTIDRLTEFARETDPLVTQLRPAARELSPTLTDLAALAPDLAAFFRDLGPLIDASRRGFPAAERTLQDLRPLLGAARSDRAPAQPRARRPGLLQARADRVLRQHGRGDAGHRAVGHRARPLPAHHEPVRPGEPRRLSAPHRVQPHEPLRAARALRQAARGARLLRDAAVHARARDPGDRQHALAGPAGSRHGAGRREPGRRQRALLLPAVADRRDPALRLPQRRRARRARPALPAAGEVSRWAAS